jgi:hypothetical protein
MPEPDAKKKKTIPQRLVHAWEPLRGSFSIASFGILTVFQVLLKTFDLEEKLEKHGWWPPWASFLNYTIYAFVFLFFLRAMFLLAEENGELREDLAKKGEDCGSARDENKKLLSRYRNVITAIRDTVHDTRDALFSEQGFSRLVETDGEEGVAHFYTIIES